MQADSVPVLLQPSMQWTLAIFAFVLGACVGSFLNVVIYRMPLGISVTNPKRSFCPGCKYQIPAWLNIPLFSWATLGGKCKNCGSGISPRYFFVELLTGCYFLMTYCAFRDQPWLCLPYWIMGALCISATYIDLDHTIIPLEISYGGVVAGLVCAGFVPGVETIFHPERVANLTPWWRNLMDSGIGALAGAGVIFAVVQLGKLFFGRLNRSYKSPIAWSLCQPDPEGDIVLDLSGEEHRGEDIFSRKTDKLRIICHELLINHEKVADASVLTVTPESVSWLPEGGTLETRPLEGVKHLSGQTTAVTIPREAMGLGDVHFMALIGAFTGWKGVLFTLLAASIIGAVISLISIILKRREATARIPFGPYLAVGGLLWVFAGKPLLMWYLNFALGDA